MLNDKAIVAVIPARGGSKSVPGKNIRNLGGKPLLAWSIDTALRLNEIDRVIVSTDDDRIADVAREYGAEVYLRPASLATDEALVIDALRNLNEQLKGEDALFDIMVLLEPTCPFRTAEDVSACLNRLVEDDLQSVATFKPAALNPYRAWRLEFDTPYPFLEEANPWLPRQELPEAYQLNGAVYAFCIQALPVESPGLLFGRSGAVLMPLERSVDIDNEMDFSIAERMLEKKNE